MVGKNNRTKVVQANLKQHYKAYKVGRHWVFASLASLSLGAALFLGGTVTSYAETTDTDTTNDTQTDSAATSAATATTAKTVTLPSTTKQSSNSSTETDASATNVTASNSNVSNQTTSKNVTDATKQSTTVAKSVQKETQNEQQPTSKPDVDNANQSTTSSKSNSGYDRLNDSSSKGAQADVSTTSAKTASNLEPTSTSDAKTNAQKVAQPKTATTNAVPTEVDTAKVAQLEAQLKTLLVNPSATDIDQAKTVASQLYALTGKPQQFAAVAADAQSTVLLSTSTDKVGYGQPAGDVVITAKMTVNTGDTVTITVPTNLDDLEWSSVQKLQDSLGTTQYTKNADGTYTVTNTFNQSGIFTQKITLKQVANGADSDELPKLTPDQIGKDTTGEVTATLNGSPVDPLTLTQTTKPSIAISNPTRVTPALTSKDADGNPFSVDTVIPDTNYVYKVNVTDSTGLKDDSGDGINSRLNTNGTTITIPVPTGFTLDSALTDTLNGFAAGTTTIKQDAGSGNIVITVPANTEVGKGGFYLAGKYTNELTDKVQTLTATGKPTITQKIPNGQTLTATSNPWTEKLAAKGDGVAPAVGSVTAAGNSSNASDKLVLDTDTSNDPLYLSSFGFGVTSSTPVTDAKLTITVPDGIDATGVVVPKETVSRDAYLPGTTEYGYTIILADGTTETGTVAAGDTISKGNTTSLIKQIVLTPNYLAAGATTGTDPRNIDAAHKDNYIHLLGKLNSKYADGKAVKNGDGLKFNINIQMPEDTKSMDSWANETVSNPVGNVDAFRYQGGTDATAPGTQNSGYISISMNGSSGQTTDEIYEPIIYMVLPLGTNVNAVLMRIKKEGSPDLPNPGKVSYYTTSTGQTGVKLDYTGTGRSVHTDSTFDTEIVLNNDADALPGTSYAYYYVTSPTTPISNNQKATDSKIGDPASDKTNPNADLSFVDGDVNALVMKDNRQKWTIEAATGTYERSMAQGNQDGMPENTGTADANGDSELDFYTNMVNASATVKDASVAINLPEVGDDQGSTYTFQLSGPNAVTVPTTFTTSSGTGSDPLTPTVLYSTSHYDKTGTAVDTTGYVTADQVSDWSAVRSVIVQVGDVPADAATGRIKLTGTTSNFNDITSPDKQIGYLQTTLYENGAAASVTNKATSITIISKSTVNARIHYKDATGDHYISLDSLSKTLVNNTDKLNASDFPSTEDKLTAAESSLSDTDKNLISTLISNGYYWAKNSDGSLKTTIVNSDHGNYGTDKPNKVAAFGATSQYYFDGDTVQYELTNVANLTVTYVDTDDNNKVVGTPETITGDINDIGSYTVTVPDHYVLANGQDTMVPYTLTTDDTDNIVIKLEHKIDSKTNNATVTRTINYVYGDNTVDHQKGDKAENSVEQKQDYTQTETTDEVTDKVTLGTWTATTGASEGLGSVTTTAITGYKPDKMSVDQSTVDLTKLTTGKTAENPITVTYNPEGQTVQVHYIDVTGYDKSDWADAGTEVTSAKQTLNGTTDGVYTNKLVVPTGYIKVGQDAGAVSGFFDNDSQKSQNYYVYLKHGTKPVAPDNDQLKATVTRTINYVYGDNTVDHQKGDKAENSVEQKQDYTRTGIIDEVTGKTTYSTWTATTGTGEGLGSVTTTAITGYIPDKTSVNQATVDLTKLTAGKTAEKPITVTYNPEGQAVQVHYMDVTGYQESDWTKGVGTEVTSAKQTLMGTTDGVYTNKLVVPTGYIKVGQNAGAVSGFFDNDSQKSQNYYVYLKHDTKPVAPDSNQLKATVTRTINYVYGDNTVDHQKGDKAANLVNQHQDYTRTGTIDEVTGKVTYSVWTATTGTGEGLGSVTTTAITGYKPDKMSVDQSTVDLTKLTAGETAEDPITVTYNPEGQTVQVHYIDVTGYDKSDWADAGTEVTSAKQTLNGTTDGVYTNKLVVPMGYIKVGQDARAVSGFFDNDSQKSQDYYVYLKHGTKPVAPDSNQLKATVTRTINYVYGNDTVDHRKGDQAFNPFEQHQDYTRTGTIDKVTGTIIYSAWTPTTGDSEGLGSVTSGTLTGYTPNQASVAQAVVDLKDVANKALTPVTVTYNPDAQTVQIHYIDVTGSTKTSDWVPTDGNEVTTAEQTLNGTTDGVYTNPITLPTNYVKVGQDNGTVSGFFDKDSQTNQNYNVYVKHATKTITPTNDPKNDQLKATVTRTINYVYGDNTVDHQKGAQAADSVNQRQDYTRTGTIDEVTGKVTYSAWTPTTETGEGLTAVTSAKITGYTPDQVSVSAGSVDLTTLNGNETLKPVTVTYNPNPAKIAVTYVDDVENGKVVEGTTLDGLVDKTGTFNVIVPNNYELSKGQSGKVAYTFTPNDGTIIIHLSHQIAHTTTITTRTINYFIQGTTTPIHASEVQPLTWNITTDKVTGATVAVPEGGYPEVKSPLVSGYTADQTSVDNDYPGAVVGKSAGNTTVTVYYTANPIVPDNGVGNEVTPPTTPETTPTVPETPETTPTTDGGTVPNEPKSETTDNGRVPNQGNAGTNSTGSDTSSGTGVTEQAGQSGLAETGTNAQSVSSQQTTASQQTAATSGNTAAKLPQTNEQNTNVWSSLGLGLMSLMSLLGLAKRKKHEND